MKYHDITHDDMKNGDGLRVVLWVSGCSHHCPGCQNPVTWDPEDGKEFMGDEWEEIETELDKDYISGLTITGGDPLYFQNRWLVTELCRMVKDCFPKKTIWLYTGYRYSEIISLPVLEYIDVLIDGPYIEALRDPQLKWRGSSNQRVIDVQQTRKLGSIVLYCD